MKSTMSAKQYRDALSQLGINTQSEAAKFLKVSLRTAHGYANKQPVPFTVAELLRQLVSRAKEKKA